MPSNQTATAPASEANEVETLLVFDKLLTLNQVIPLSLAKKTQRVRSSLLNALTGQRVNLVSDDEGKVALEVMGGGSPAWTQTLTYVEARALLSVWEKQSKSIK